MPMMRPEIDREFEAMLRRLNRESLWAQAVVVAMAVGAVLWMMFG